RRTASSPPGTGITCNEAINPLNQSRDKEEFERQTVFFSSLLGLFDIEEAGTVLQQAYPQITDQPPSLCPRPTIVSVSPNFWVAGKSYQVTIRGTGFTSPENATESCPVPWFTAGSDSETLLNTTILNATTAIGTVATAENAQGGTAVIQVWYLPPPDDVEPNLPPNPEP
ncbi:MAG: hypothetical protein WB524_24595, partial [Acidobacteriaceae bacterium]